MIEGRCILVVDRMSTKGGACYRERVALLWQGWDKTYCLQFVEEEFSEIHFFGDKTFAVSRHLLKP